MIQSLTDALQERGYETLTPVQTAVTDTALDGKDLLVSAQTGSGKTVAFGLAIAPTLLGDSDRFERAAAPLALIIAPTRELALQVKRELSWLYAKAGAVVTSCVGGMDMRDERRALDRGAHIVVATPGRLRDHISRGSIDLSGARAVVLDEADEMLDLGFREDLEFILSEAPESRRTLLFSATVPKAIERLAQSYQRDAERVSTVAERSQHADIEYRAMTVAPQDAENSIINVLRYYEAATAIVFCNTRAMVNRLTTRFSNRGFSVVALSGELTQNERSHALQAMRDGRARVCVATDVAARGIDLPNLELVVHAELPNNHETLLHRSGRTGRAGRKGVSAMIVPMKLRRKAERLLGSAKLNAEWADAPSADDVNARDEERLFNDPVWTEPVGESEADLVAKLVERFDATQLAAAYTQLYRQNRSAPEELAAAGSAAAPKARPAFGESVWFSVSVGRKDNAEPRWLLPAMCRAGDLTKDDIGAIRIQQNASFVEILKSSVDGFLKALGTEMKLDDGARVTQLDAAPDFASMPRPQGKPPRRDGDKPFKKKPYEKKPFDKKPFDKGDRGEPGLPKGGKAIADARADGAVTEHKPRPAGEKKPYDKKPQGKKPDGKKPYEKKPFEKRDGDKKPFDKKGGKKPFEKKEGGKDAGKRPFEKRDDGGKPKGKGKPKGNPNDTSKRFVPPGKSAKPRVGKGASATPKRSKPKR